MKILVAVVLIVIGLLALGAGVVYLTQPAHSLPSFFPSHVSARAVGASVYHRKKGAVGVGLGIVLVVIGSVVALVRPTQPAANQG